MEEQAKKSFSLQRQIYLVVGLVVLLSVVLGAFASKWWLLLAFAVSLGMLNAARTGVCPLMKLLSGLPFNEPSSGDIS
jgi:hypothetical protein